MRWAATLTIAGIAEAAAALLSLGWGFAVITGAFIAVALRVSATMATVTAKAYSTETRLNAHIVAAAPAVNFMANGGTVGGSVLVNGNHNVTGTLGVNGGAVTNSMITNAMTVFGDSHTTGNHFVTGSTTANGNVGGSSLSASGGMTSNSVATNGIANFGDTHTSGTSYSGPFSGNSIHVSGNAQADGSLSAGSLSAGNFSGSYHGSQGGVSTVGGGTAEETALASAINGIIARLNSAGLT